MNTGTNENIKHIIYPGSWNFTITTISTQGLKGKKKGHFPTQ